jgi:hypothetical protein
MTFTRYYISFKAYSTPPGGFLIGTGLKNIDTKYCYKKAALFDYKILKLMGIIKMAERGGLSSFWAIQPYIPWILAFRLD